MNVYVVTADEYNNAGHTECDLLNCYVDVFGSKASAQDYVNKNYQNRCLSYGVQAYRKLNGSTITNHVTNTVTHLDL